MSFNKSILNNGIRVVTECIPSVRSISVGIWVEAGSRDESDADAGMSHFIEHMVFKGTASRRAHQIAERMESVGGYLNAFTTKEHTCFYARALDEHLERAIDTVTDLIFRPLFPERDLEKEKDVVVEEMRMYEDSPEDYAFDLLDGALFSNHALGRPIIGYESTVRGFSAERLREYMKSHYAADRIVIAAAGNLEHGRVVRLIEKCLSGENISKSPRISHVPEGYQPGNVTRLRPTQQAHLLMGTRAFSVHHDRRAALSVLNTVLGGGMSSFLNQNIREKYGYCYTIYSFCNMHSDAGDFGVYMGTDKAKIDRSKSLIMRELARMADKTISNRKLSRTLNQVKGSIMLGLESMGSRMMRIARQELFYGRYFTLDEIMDQVDAVTAEDIRSVAEELFDPARFSTIQLIPDPSAQIISPEI